MIKQNTDASVHTDPLISNIDGITVGKPDGLTLILYKNGGPGVPRDSKDKITQITIKGFSFLNIPLSAKDTNVTGDLEMVIRKPNYFTIFNKTPIIPTILPH